MIREVLIGVELREVPARHIGVNAIHERGVVPHFRWQRAQQVANALLVLDLDIKVTHHDDTPLGPDAFLTAGEFSGLHVSLENVDAVLLVERDAGDFVEANDVVLAHQASLTRGVVDKHLRHRRLTARDQMRIR